MCKYNSTCDLCHYEMEIRTEQSNMQDVYVKISSPCPNLEHIIDMEIKLDAMQELMVPKEESRFYNLLSDDHQKDKCIVYESVKEAIGKNLGRYFELA